MRLLRRFWKLLVAIKDGLVLLFMLLFFGGLFAALSMTPNTKTVSSGALLVTLDGNLVEQPSEADPLATVTSQSPISRQYRLRDVVRAIGGAATDASVKAVVLDLDGFDGGGQAALASVGEAIDRVRRAGKPVLAFATGYRDGGYLLAAHASEVWLDPMGTVLLTGRGGSQLYYKGLMNRLGVTARVYRVGQFKSAVEPYTRSDMSPEARAADQALADSLWQTWLDAVGRARPKAQVAAYARDPRPFAAAAGGDTAGTAVAAGLVDKLGDRVAFGRRVAQLAGAGSDTVAGNFAKIPLDRWIAAHPEPGTGAGIGVVTVAGEIVDGDAPAGTAGGDTISRLILKALSEKKLRALVVRVDSPGGSVAASEKIRGAIVEARRQGLPVVVSMGSVAASGGYWITTPAERIFADPATITGSIGVFGIIPTFEGALKKLGVGADGVKTTPLSGEPDVLRGTSPQFDAIIQLGVDDIYRHFIALVGAARRMPPQRVDQIGQGRVWAGGTARQLGLVDQFGGLDEAIAYAARRARLDPGNVHPVWIEKEPDQWLRFIADMFGGDRDDDAQARDAWSRAARRPEAMLRTALADAQRVASGPVMQARCLECVSDAPPPPDRSGLSALLLAWLGR